MEGIIYIYYIYLEGIILKKNTQDGKIKIEPTKSDRRWLKIQKCLDPRRLIDGKLLIKPFSPPRQDRSRFVYKKYLGQG